MVFATLLACNFIRKETLAEVFPVNFAKFSRTSFLENTSGKLLLHFQKQSSRGVLQKRCSWKFHKIHRQENTCARVFLIKLQASNPQLYFKKRLWHRCIPVNFAKFLRRPFFIEHLLWLCLSLYFIFQLKISGCLFSWTHINIFLYK